MEMEKEILYLLQNNAKISSKTLAAMLDINEAEVEAIV